LFTIIDIETTGGSPVNDRIIEIAIVVHNGKRVIEEYASLINPERHISNWITALTGISEDMVSDAPTFREVAERIQELTHQRVFVAHNARFDYGFVKQEFNRIGVRFSRKQLCTVKLARKILPGYRSYSLGNICSDLKIPVDNRHRAFGDAEATAVLFEKLMFNDRHELIHSSLKSELETSSLPPNMKWEQIDALPEETGVYYFLDEKGKNLYIGKSKNIRKRIIQHFAGDLKQARFRSLKDRAYDISFEQTGNELIALLQEASEIKRFMPEFNMAQRRQKYRYGIFIDEDENGFLNLKSDLLHPDKNPVIKYANKKRADGMILHWLENYQLHPQRCGFDHETNNPLLEKDSLQSYNDRVLSAVKKHMYDRPHFLIIGEGRKLEEKSIVAVENGKYLGFGFFEPEFVSGNPEELKSFIQPGYDNPDIHRIIRAHLKKRKSDKIIYYHPEEKYSLPDL